MYLSSVHHRVPYNSVVEHGNSAQNPKVWGSSLHWNSDFSLFYASGKKMNKSHYWTIEFNNYGLTHTWLTTVPFCLLFWFSFSLTVLRTRRETDLIIVLLTREVRWYGTLCSLLLKALASDWDENLGLLAIYLASSKIAYFDACEVITTIHNGNWFPSTCCQVSDLIAIQK